MTDAIGYTRLSQASDTSIPRQKEHIRAYADEHGFELLALYDDGERSSGFDDDREAYQQVRERVAAGEPEAIIVNDKRRLARDFDETMRLILDCREAAIQIHTYQAGQLDLADPMNAAIEVVQAASDYEAKKQEIEKAKAAVEERIESGAYHGSPPFGLEFADDNRHLRKADAEWDDLLEIIERRPEDDVETIAEDVGVSVATVSRAANRGVEWYERKLDVYGR